MPLRSTRLSRTVASVLLSSLALIGFGCGPTGGPLPLEALAALQDLPANAFDQVEIVGGNNQRLMLARTRFSDLLGFAQPIAPRPVRVGQEDVSVEPDDFPVPLTDFLAVDLATLETRVVLSATSADTFSAISDGTWLVWSDFEADLVRAVRIDNGVETRLLEGFVQRGFVQPAGLSGDRLALHIGADGTSAVAVIDLTTGGLRLFGPTSPVIGQSTGSLDGDLLAIAAQPVFDPGSQTLEDLFAPPSIEVVNLATGGQITAIENAGGRSIDNLTISAGRVLWVEHNDAFTSSTVRAFDTATGQNSDVLVLEDPSETSSSFVSDIGTPGVLVERSAFPASPQVAFDLALTGTRSYVLHRFDGSAETVFEFEEGISEIAFFASQPRLVGDFVVYRHPFDGEIVIYDTLARSERRVDAFGP